MAHFHNNALIGAAGLGDTQYIINRSLRFNSGDTSYLNRTPSSASNRYKWTWSAWVKRSGIGANDDIFKVSGSASKATEFRVQIHNGNYVSIDYGGAFYLKTNRLLRDPSAWMHLVVAVDTTNSTADNRIRLYINGSEETSFDTRNNPNQYEELAINTTSAHTLSTADSNGLDGYLAEVHFVDGQALAPTDFGEFDANNVWNPKKFTGTYNTAASFPSYPGVTISPSAFGGSVSHVNGGGTYFYSLASSGAGSVKVEFSSPITGVTSIKYNGGGYSVNSTYNIKINGVDALTNLTTAYLWNQVSHTISSTDISSFEIYTANDGWSLYNLLFNDTSPSGTPSLLNPAGVNGYHLDFSDNSSNAALGTDSSGNSNTWTVNNLKAVGNFGLTNAAQIVGTSKTFSFPITYTTTLTYEFFVRITTDGTYNYMAKLSADQWNLGTSGSSLLFGNFNGGWTTFSSTGLNDSEWHFVRLTTTGSSTSLYVDGSLIATNSSGGSVSTGSQVTNQIRGTGSGAFEIAHLRITTGGTPPTTGVPDIATMNAAAGSGGTLAFYDKLDDIASSGTKTSDGGNVTITMSAATVTVDGSDTDSLIDSPTNYDAGSGNNGGNYCTLNPLKNQSQTLKNGNLVSNGVSGRSTGTLYASSGKFYWEFTAGSSYTMAGIESSTSPQAASYSGENNQQYALYGNNGSGQLYHNGGTSSFDGFVSGDVIGVALDMDNGNLYFYKNGAAMNSGNAAATGLTGAWTANCRSGSGAYNGDTVFNFGQRPFAHTPPTGYKSLCTTNLPDPTIADGSTAFGALTYSGNGSARTLTGLNMNPDFIWIKSRSAAQKHTLVDSVRTTSTGEYLASNSNQAEGTGVHISGTANGITIADPNASTIWYNDSSHTYVAWAWDGGSSTSSNTAGSINSSVRAKPSAGFSIVTWTGQSSGSATIGHGLNAAPEFIILKGRTGSVGWTVGHESLGWTKRLKLDGTDAESTSSNYWNDTAPTTSVFTAGANNVSNTFVAYCFAPVEGYSAFGSYTGNGSADGPFVYTGFRPRFLLIKEASTNGNGWVMIDSERDPHNVIGNILFANDSSNEETGSSKQVDLVSNGFKLKASGHGINVNSNTYVYAAFAEHPFKTARAR